MTKGRRPRPAHLRAVEGVSKVNPGRENDEAPNVLPHGLGDPLPGLSDAACEVWKERAPWWGGDTDRGEFAAYCTAIADAEYFYDLCESEGWILESASGNQYRHPASTLYRENDTAARKLAAAFGMNPTDRQRLRVKDQPKPSASDKFRKGR